MYNEEREMKVIVETTGSFMLLNSSREEIAADRPSVTTYSPFVDARIQKGQLRTLATDLPMDANDDDFYQTYSEMTKGKKHGDLKKAKKAAIEAYCATLGMDRLGEKTEVEPDTEGDKAQKEREAVEAKEKAEAEEKAKAEAEEKAKAEAEANKPKTQAKSKK